MSRSALWRQEGNQKGRQRQAEDLFQLAVEEGRNSRQKLPIWGPDDTFHFNPMLLQNTIKSSYFQKCCRDITDWSSLVDEIYYQVKHLEPWATGSSKEVSTAFCLLLRLLTLRCTEKQMSLLLDHPDSPYIRAIGFLYLRYVGEPSSIWKWIQPYLYDEEPIQIRASSAKQKQDETIGDFVRLLYREKNYFGTMLPRLPIQLERELQVKLLQAEKIEERAKKHARNGQRMEYFKRVGNKVRALYGDDENPIQWYDAIIDRVLTTNEDTNQALRNPKFVVTFPEYGNTETVCLGEMEMPGSDEPYEEPRRGGFSDSREQSRYDGYRGRDDRGYQRSDRNRRGYEDQNRGYGDRDRGYNNYRREERGYNKGREDRGYNDRRDTYRSRDDDRRGYYGDDRWDRGQQYKGRSKHGDSALPSEDDLYEEVRRRERDTVTSSSRNPISRRPPSTKHSFAYTNDSGRRSSSPPRQRPMPSTVDHQQAPPKTESAAPPRKRSAEELAAIQEKKRKLMAKYG